MRDENLDDLPRRERKSSANFDWDRSTGLFINGLRRKIAANVGRPWDNVYSELIQFIKENYKERCWEELRKSIFWFVEVKPMHVGKGVYAPARGLGWHGLGFHWNHFYVNPNTGLLCKPKKSWKKIIDEWEKNESIWKQEVQYLNNRCYRKIKGKWHEVELISITNAMRGTYSHSHVTKDSVWELNLYDVLLKKRLRGDDMGSLSACHGYRCTNGKLISHETYSSFEGMFNYHYVYAKSLRQLGSSEVANLGLDNGKLTAPNLVPKHKKKRH